MIVLGIESTCDETACALVKDGREILSNVIASQTETHRPYNGVFPEMASRQHVDLILPTLKQALDEAHLTREAIDLIAVAKGPGLMGSLLVGLHAAKTLSLAWNVPFIGINHVEAHLYAAMMSSDQFIFPSLGIVVSGGHTFLVHMTDFGKYELIGTTVDDAIGEAFDKVAAMLGLPYPGGPAIESLAKLGDPKKYSFKAGKVKSNPWNFSFSGLKTSVLYAIKGQNASQGTTLISNEDKTHIAASFQEAALSDVVSKIAKATQLFPCSALYIGGGVSNNQRLRQMLSEKIPSMPTYWPSLGLSLDNAAMIAGLGAHIYLRDGKGDSLDLEPTTKILHSWLSIDQNYSVSQSGK